MTRPDGQWYIYCQHFIGLGTVTVLSQKNGTAQGTQIWPVFTDRGVYSVITLRFYALERAIFH